MKSLFALLTILAATSPAFASSLAETITCHPTGVRNAGELQIQISTYNRPDFDLGKYDSKDEANNEGIELKISRGGKAVKAELITYAFVDGKMKPIMDRDSKGNACALGSETTGMQLAAKITVAHKEKLVVLTCNDSIYAPHGGDCQE